MDTYFVNKEDIIYEEDLNMEVPTLIVSRYIIKKPNIYYIVINCYIV